MARLLAGLTVAVFTAIILGVSVHAGELEDRGLQVVSVDEFFQMFCKEGSWLENSDFCKDTLASLTSPKPPMTSKPMTTPAVTTEAVSESSPSSPSSSSSSSSSSESSSNPTTSQAVVTSESTTLSPSALERAHWCRFSNGSYISLGYSFMYSACAVCQCTQSHAIRCTNLQCMSTYCIDNSKPQPKPGQCCAQCQYETKSTGCIVNGITFPHGTILKRTSDNVQCWCQLGTVECRKYASSAFSSLDFWGEGTAVYVVVVIVIIMLLIGTLVCGAGSLFFYYYYKRNQQATQQAYEHYYNSAGWQPMSDEGQVDGSAEEKKAEAEQQNQFGYEYPTGSSEQYIPPPYALYNGTYLSEQPAKEQL